MRGVQTRELTLETLEFFSRVEWATPDEYMIAIAFYPRAAAYSWLYKLCKRRWWLRRSLNVAGRIQYQLTGNGARRLLYLKQRKAYNGEHENQTW